LWQRDGSASTQRSLAARSEAFAGISAHQRLGANRERFGGPSMSFRGAAGLIV
jgi:hypothetical protein